MRPKSGFLFRSKTPTAELFSTQEKEVVPMRPKTPIVDTRNMSQKGWNTGEVTTNNNINSSPFTRNDISRASLGGSISQQFSGVSLTDGPRSQARSQSPGRDLDYLSVYPGFANNSYNGGFNQNHGPGYNQYSGYNGYNPQVPSGYEPGYGYTGYNAGQDQQGGMGGYRSGSLPRGRKESTSFEQSEPVPSNIRWPRHQDRRAWEDLVEITVTLLRHESGFGFRIVGGTEEGSQVRRSYYFY